MTLFVSLIVLLHVLSMLYYVQKMDSQSDQANCTIQGLLKSVSESMLEHKNKEYDRIIGLIINNLTVFRRSLLKLLFQNLLSFHSQS